MKLNLKLLGMMLVLLLSLGSCVKKCPGGLEKEEPFACPKGQINVDDGTTSESCVNIKVVKDLNELEAEIKQAIGFGGLVIINWTKNLNYIDTSAVTDMSYLFTSDAGNNGRGTNLNHFNGRIDKWDTSNVTSMDHMFHGNHEFNQPIGNWKTGRVNNMESMFSDAIAFNQDIGNWDLKYVQSIGGMLAYTDSFSQDLSKWMVYVAPAFMATMFQGSLMEKLKQLSTKAPWYCAKVPLHCN